MVGYVPSKDNFPSTEWFKQPQNGDALEVQNTSNERLGTMVAGTSYLSPSRPICEHRCQQYDGRKCCARTPEFIARWNHTLPTPNEVQLDGPPIGSAYLCRHERQIIESYSIEDAQSFLTLVSPIGQLMNAGRQTTSSVSTEHAAVT